MAARVRKRVPSNDEDASEVIDNPTFSPAKRRRQSVLPEADLDLFNSTQSWVKDMARTNDRIVKGIKASRSLDKYITQHEATVQRYLKDNEHRREAFKSVGEHRKTWEQLKSQFASIAEGILGYLKEVTTNGGPSPPGIESLREEMKSKETTAAAYAQCRRDVIETMKNENASLRRTVESLGKAVESMKQYPSQDVQLSPESLRKAIEEPTTIYINKVFEDVSKRTQPLEELLQSILRTQKPSQPTHSSGIDRYLNSKQVQSWNFVYHLKNLDFRPPSGMWTWANTTWQLPSYDLWGKDNLRYLLRFNLQLPVCLERHCRGHGHDYSARDYLGSPDLLCYLQYVMEIEMLEKPAYQVSKNIPKYVIYLGDLFVQGKSSDDGHPSYETSENNMCLVMDVTKPTMPLWLVYKYEYQTDKELREFGFHPDRKSFPSIETQFDFVSIADDIGDWRESDQNFPYQHLDHQQVEHTMRHTACRVKPVFTKPKLDDVLRAIEYGWAGHEYGHAE